ncbi:hypothetical protein DGWBC_1796 [Dehalogenimonas sp. WBC-2]|nr:hypothetical protein DGWBC_1796 [Dehalogenimonas sp. WBC-2]
MSAISPEITSKDRWRRFLHWEHLGLFIIVLVTLIFHFIAIERPATIVWDEKWYVGDARSIISGTGELRTEHPPLGKLFIAAGEYIFNGFKAPEEDTGVLTQQSIYSYSSENSSIIEVSDSTGFNAGDTIRIGTEQMNVTAINAVLDQITVERGAGGSIPAFHDSLQPVYVYTDNAFGWRFFSIVFGTAGIVIVYFICRKLRLSPKATLLATFLFAAEDMTFLHSGLALLDVYLVTFMLAAVWCYLDERYLWSGVLVALSANCKLAGAFILIALCLHWLVYRRTDWKRMFGLLAVAAVSFVCFLVFFDFFIKGGLENPVTRIHELLSGSLANTFTDPKMSISSRPWEWLYPQWLRPEYYSPFLVYSFNPQYISFISSTIQIMTLPAMGYMTYRAVKGSRAAGLVLLWFLATYLVWIPLDIITNRVTYVFYFLSTTPAVCIAIGMALGDSLDKLKARRLSLGGNTPWARTAYIAIGLYLLLHLAIFVVFNPAIPPIIKTWLPPFVS